MLSANRSSLSPLSLSLATRQKRREPRKLNFVSRVTFTVNERIFFFSLSPSLSLSPIFTPKETKERYAVRSIRR